MRTLTRSRISHRERAEKNSPKRQWRPRREHTAVPYRSESYDSNQTIFTQASIDHEKEETKVKWDGGVRCSAGHGGLQERWRSGEFRTGKSRHCTLTSTRLTQLRGGGGRGQRVEALDIGGWAMPWQHSQTSSPECLGREGDDVFRL
jgi:hypothetical protein